MRHILTLLVCLSLLFTVSCREKKVKDKDFYLSEEFPLRQLVKTEITNKSENGYFFLIVGVYSNTEEQITVVKVFAKIEGTYRYLELPLENIRININEKYKTPTIQFRDEGERRLDDVLYWVGEKQYSGEIIINCSEEYLPERLLPIKI